MEPLTEARRFAPATPCSPKERAAAAAWCAAAPDVERRAADIEAGAADAHAAAVASVTAPAALHGRRAVCMRHRDSCHAPPAAITAAHAARWHDLSPRHVPPPACCTVLLFAQTAPGIRGAIIASLMAAGMTVHRFGPFELASGRLFRGQQRVPLSDTQAAILVHLVANAGEVVARDALIQAAWGNTAVTENSLGQAIRRLRQALAGGRHGAVYIETLTNHGYRFAERVERAERDAPAASLDAQIAPYRAFVQGRTELDTLDAEAIQRARCAFEDAVRLAPEYADAHVGLAMACGLAFEASGADAPANASTVPSSHTTLLQQGIEHARRGCTLSPSSGEAWSTLAFVLYLSGDSDEAAAAACKAAALDPENSRHALRLAFVSWGDERLRAAGRVLALGPGLALAHWLRATVFIARGAFDAAGEELRLGCAAQDAQPKQSVSGFPAVGLHLLAGLVHAAHDRLDEAAAALAQELRSADSGQMYAKECAANTCYALGAVRLRQHKRDEAEDAFTRALTIAPCHVSAAAALRTPLPPTSTAADAYVGRAIVLATAGRHADAAQVYREAVSHAPPGPAGWLLPVEPTLNPLARPEIWAETLALVRLRAT